MHRVFRVSLLTCFVGLLASAGQVCRAADEYSYDPVHSSISFKARHADVSWIHGRFNEAEGKFSIDKADPTKSTFELKIKADSVDTGNKARDEHLRQPDYFDTKQFPTIEFKSTSTKAIDGGYEVTGDFKMHGVTKKVTLVLKGGDKVVEFNKKKVIGFSTRVSVKRSDFGFDKSAIGVIGDEALIDIDCEGVR
ncbi:MAG: YceI family protein [Planctomycetes bacterium]|nr:YceI family protein [Planctomycetota bacterium]